MAPVSNRVARASQLAVDRLRVPSQLDPKDFFGPSDEVRHLFSSLIDIDTPDRVAIVPSVSYAMATLARNTPVRAGQNVVIVHEQFPSNVYTWRRVCETVGAELRTVAPPDTAVARGDAWNAALLDAIDPQTAVVTIPELHWTDGTRFDLAQVGRRARDRGALFIIDGTQSVGALPFSVAHAQPDAVVCGGYKWLMGPYSIGLAYYGPRYDGGIPIEENWITRLGSDDFAGLVEYSDAYHPGAIRYDVGERSNFVLIPMLTAGLTQVLEWGPAAIQDYCRAVTATATNALRNLGCWIEADDARAAHLFGVRLPSGCDRESLRAALADHQVSISLRGSAIRVSPHVYNDAADLDALVASVQDAMARSAAI